MWRTKNLFICSPHSKFLTPWQTLLLLPWVCSVHLSGKDQEVCRCRPQAKSLKRNTLLNSDFTVFFLPRCKLNSQLRNGGRLLGEWSRWDNFFSLPLFSPSGGYLKWHEHVYDERERTACQYTDSPGHLHPLKNKYHFLMHPKRILNVHFMHWKKERFFWLRKSFS